MKNLTVFLVLSFTLAACAGGSPDGASTSESARGYKMVSGNKADPEYGEEVTFLYGAMSGATGMNANGVAFLRVYQNGVTRVTVNLNIALAESGERYVVELSRPDNVLVECAALTSVVGDERHSAECEVARDLSEYTSVNVLKVRGSTKILVAHGTVKAPSKPLQ